MENQELFEFLSYLSDRDNQVDKELKPYYEAILQMEERHMNSYIHTTPHQWVLLDESGTICRLRKRISSISSIDELRNSIKEDMQRETTNDAQVFLQREMDFLEEYQNLKKQSEKTSFNK